MYLILSILIALSTIALYLFVKIPNPPKIFTIYSQPNKWYFLKYIFITLILYFNRFKKSIYLKDRETTEASFEKLQPLSNHEQAFDAVFFYAVSTEKNLALWGGLERRQQGKANGVFYVLTPEHGLLLSEQLPKTSLNVDAKTIWIAREYSAGGISFKPVEPMRRWMVTFNGRMRSQENPEDFFQVKLNAIWCSETDWFLFESDVPVSNLARAIAREEWNKKLFESLNQAHQTHYEQMGLLRGTLRVESTKYELKLGAFRDHSFGFKRDWSLMHRYIYHVMFLEDGTKISLGIISQPCTSSHLELGFIVFPNGKQFPIKSCSIKLYKHGENGRPNKDLGFTFKANRHEFIVKIVYKNEAVHFVGNDVEAKMFERFFQCNVNGIPGRGIAEYHYNNETYKDT